MSRHLSTSLTHAQTLLRAGLSASEIVHFVFARFAARQDSTDTNARESFALQTPATYGELAFVVWGSPRVQWQRHWQSVRINGRHA